MLKPTNTLASNLLMHEHAKEEIFLKFQLVLYKTVFKYLTQLSNILEKEST